MIIGIDLGTTFSVIAVNGKVDLVEGYPEAHYMDLCDVSIIPDPEGNLIIPSAMWEDPENPGMMVLGNLAKQTASQGYNPILFSKRDIGTNIRHTLGEYQFTSRQVACELLKYLKGVAEQALGQPVTQAVITHPAYFNQAMCEETGLAAQDAGFDFDLSRHLLMEPIAAALAYTRTDQRDPLRVLTYDLGGGTFDVTVMERRGVFTIKQFGGNRLLGGYNFDRALAEWIYNRMRERGVKLTLNADDPESGAKWARLMNLAESLKLELAEMRNEKSMVHIRRQAIFTDDTGRPIHLNDQINREQYEALIQDMVDGTIVGEGGDGKTMGCSAVLRAAGMTIDQIDEILLVGGSSNGPWIQKAVKNHYNREAQIFEPDLCVGAGAAIYATTLPDVVQGMGCTVEIDAPRETALFDINIGGQLKPNDGAALPIVSRLTLIDSFGKRYQTDLHPDGTFLFERVPLESSMTTGFDLQVLDAQKHALLAHHFEVTHNPEASATGIMTVLPKPLYVDSLRGMVALAEEGVELPASCDITLRRINDHDTIELDLLQENICIGKVEIHDVPKGAIGGTVKLNLRISRENRISGQAEVNSPRGALVCQAPVDIRIPAIQVPELHELNKKLKDLRMELEDKLGYEDDANRRLEMADGQEIASQANEALKGPSPDRQDIWMKVRELERTVHPPEVKLQPSREEYDGLVAAINTVFRQHGDDPQVGAHRSRFEKIRAGCEKAYQARDQREWAKNIGELFSLFGKLREIIGGGDDRGGDLPPTPALKQYFGQQADQCRQELESKVTDMERSGKLTARWKAVAEKLHERIDKVEAQLAQIPDELEPKQAMQKIQATALQELGAVKSEWAKFGYDV